MINWCYRETHQGEKIDSDSDAMKALEAYIYWSNTGSVLVPGKYLVLFLCDTERQLEARPRDDP